jgi:hypothetical protein
MSVSRPVLRVVEVLETSDYVRTTGTVLVGSVSYEFAAVLVGTQRSSDLILVADSIEGPKEAELRRQVLALARGLDLIGSRRPITLILVGPSPSELIIRELQRVCRVLPLGTPTGPGAERAIRDGLAVLMPLTLNQAAQAGGKPLDKVRTALLDVDAEIREPYLDAAQRGSREVRSVLRGQLAEVLGVLDD